MKRTGWLVLALMLAGLAATPAGAENDGRKNRGDRVERQLDHLKKKLSLTDEQSVKVKAILEQSKSQRETAHQEAMNRLQKIKEDTDQKLSGVLNDDQKKRFAEMRAQREERRADRKEKKGKRKSD